MKRRHCRREMAGAATVEKVMKPEGIVQLRSAKRLSWVRTKNIFTPYTGRWDIVAHNTAVIPLFIWFSHISTWGWWEEKRASAECAIIPGEVAIFQWRRYRGDNRIPGLSRPKTTFTITQRGSTLNTEHLRRIPAFIQLKSPAFVNRTRGHACGRCHRRFSHTQAQNGTNLGMVRRSPVPFASSCWENHTSSSFSVPSKKCALLSFIMRQQTPDKYG